ncbi:MAG: DMT family transporter [Elusimicrobiales bacterium]|nr:DMT family transporter [Elusimicrobiales bacterium]
MANPKSKYYLMVLFATIVWGAAYPFTKHLVLLIPVVLLVFIRALISSILFFIYIKPKLNKLLNFKFFLKIFLMSILGVTIQQYSQGYALTMTSSVNAGFLIALTPIIIVGVEIFMGNILTKDKLKGFVFGVCGTLLVSYSTGKLNLSSPSTVGDFIFISSIFTWAGYVILTKRWFAGYNQIEITSYTMLISVLTLLPFVLNINILNEISKLDTLGWISIAYLCFLSSFLGYMFWNISVEKLGAITVSYFIYDEPFATLISAYIITGEKMPMLSFYGGLLIFIGIYFVLKEKKKEYEREILS